MEEFPSDSLIWGPGIWFNIHIFSLNQTSDYFIKYIRFITEKLPCGECRDHATNYINQNSPEKYIGIKNEDGEDIGMFKWSWTFHNAVNTRLGKKYINYDTAINMFDEPDVCSSSCSQQDSQLGAQLDSQLGAQSNASSYLSIPTFSN